tara:strand:+ start:1563 stop:1784 length:222 start_codon:yes stop_codon:yes gene_type:complete
MSKNKKNTNSFVLKITYNKDTFVIKDIETFDNAEDYDKEYLVITPQAVDKRLISSLTSEDMEDLIEEYDFILN